LVPTDFATGTRLASTAAGVARDCKNRAVLSWRADGREVGYALVILDPPRVFAPTDDENDPLVAVPQTTSSVSRYRAGFCAAGS
jgi:hypothetical protein